MKKILYILIPILTLSGCETYEEQEKLKSQKIFSDRFIELENEENFEIVDIDSLQNFKELTTALGKLSCENKISGIKFNYEEKEYFLTGFSECPTFNGIACYFRRNTIIIKNDSILTDIHNKEKVVIENLNKEINEIISKPENFKYNENILKPALIHIYIDENQNIIQTKRVLREIVENFKRINSSKKDFFEYNILFEDFDRSYLPPPPPPPPLPKEILDENPLTKR